MPPLIQSFGLLAFGMYLFSVSTYAQSSEGPIKPRPDVVIQQPPKRLQNKITANVVLVNTPVIVRNSGGEMVTSLESRDFQLTDHGVLQTVSHFDLGGDPISLVVLFETSSRIAPLMPAIQKTGILITETIVGPNGETAVIGFNDNLDKLVPFTLNADEVQKTVSRLQDGGTPGSRLYDAMALGVEMLSGRPEATPTTPGKRRVLLIVSEATDVGSQAKLGEVLRQAQLANVTIYSVGLSTTRAELQAKPKQNRTTISPPGTYPLPPIPGTVPLPADEDPRLNNTVDLLAIAVWAVSHVKDKISDHALEVAATATGGAHFATFKERSIEKAMDEIGAELHAQYTLGYSPSGTSESGYHEIKVSLVEAKYKNLKVRNRPGYYIAASDE